MGMFPYPSSDGTSSAVSFFLLAHLPCLGQTPIIFCVFIKIFFKIYFHNFEFYSQGGELAAASNKKSIQCQYVNNVSHKTFPPCIWFKSFTLRNDLWTIFSHRVSTFSSSRVTIMRKAINKKTLLSVAHADIQGQFLLRLLSIPVFRLSLCCRVQFLYAVNQGLLFQTIWL